MVNYLFATEEQKELANEARKILEKELKPRIDELDEANGGLGGYPMDVHMKLVEAGFYGAYIPQEWGGLGLDPVTLGVIYEEMGKIDSGFAFSFAGSGCEFPKILKTSMPDEEKQKWADKIINEGAMGSFNLTEANAGSDAAAIRTTATFDEATNEWVINGTKCFCSNAPTASYFICIAWTDKTKRASEGVTAFFVEKERGVQIGKQERKMGLHLAGTSDVIYDNVRVPADHVIGQVGKGFAEALGGIKGAGALVNCCSSLGMAQSAYDQAVEYAKTRRQFGKRIIDFQAVGFMLADMETKIEAARALMYESLVCARDGVDSKHVDMMIKQFITDTVMQVCEDAVQVAGGYGYMKDYPFERYMRNAKIYQIFGGTNQIKRKNLMKVIAGKDPEAVRK